VVNPVLAPRSSKCRACALVATIEDLTLRLYDPDLNVLPVTGAIEYLRSVGIAGTTRQLQAIALSHRRHVDKFLERGAAVAPALIEEGLSHIPPPMGDVKWVDVNQRGMDVGASALVLLEQRIRAGGMEDKDVISAAKLGQTAAHKRAELEMKGAMKRAESIARLAAGISKPAEA